MMTSLLNGLRVLDLTMWRPGPYATQLLAQQGADVLKVEPPGGEPMRAFRSHFDLLNQRKRSVALDLKDPADRARCLGLAAGADVFVEGYRPGVAGRLGLGPETVREANPAIVYCSLSGYGATGPLRDVPGHDVNYRAHAAALAPGAPPPTADELPVADMAAATMAAFAITAAVLKARTTGEGEHLDLGMADVVAHWASTVPEATRPADGTGPLPAYGIYPTGDGHRITLGVVSEEHLWAATCLALDLPEHAGVPFLERLSRVAELDKAVADAIVRLSRDEAVARLTAAGAPVAPVLSRGEMLAHPHFRERGVVCGDGAPGTAFRTADHPAPPPGAIAGLDEHRGQGWVSRD